MIRRLVWFLPLLALFPACGGGASGAAKEPRLQVQDQDQDRDPSSLEEARAQLDRARAQLEAQGTTQGIEVTQPTTNQGGGAVQPSPAPPHVENECVRLCRAYASMQRAQSAICRMAGEDDPQCAEAKKVVEDSAKRVAKCGCR